MGSPSHRAIIMSKGYNYVGFGLAISSRGKRYWAGVYLKGPDRTGAWAKIARRVQGQPESHVRPGHAPVGRRDTRLQVLTSGLRYYQVQRRRNGGAWYNYGTTTRPPWPRRWYRNSTYEFRVRSRDKRRQLGLLGRPHHQDLTRPPGARRSRTAAPTTR